MSAGFLYVLINPSMPGLAMVGKTTRSPADRVTELSSATGVPSPFMVAFQQPVAECDSAEQWVHKELERGDYRVVDNREFFNAPLHEIIRIVVQAANLVPDATQAGLAGELGHSESSQDKLAAELYDLACAYQQGTDSLLRNAPKALSNFEQAAALGHASACSAAADYYRYGGNGVPENQEKSLAFYKKSVDLGRWFEEASVADIFLRAGQESAAKAHWNSFFERACKEITSVSDEFRDACTDKIGCYGIWYCESVVTDRFAHCVPDQVVAKLAEPLLKRIDIRISEVAHYPDRRLADFTTERLQSARRFIQDKVTALRVG